MKTIKLLTYVFCLYIAQLSFAQTGPDYDVGVFYMPFWDKKNGTPNPGSLNCTLDQFVHDGKSYTRYINCNDGPPGRWNIIHQWDKYLVEEKFIFDKVRIPKNIYWPSPVWYNESFPFVQEQHHKDMKDYGVDFVIYDYFFSWLGSDWQPYYHHAVKNLLESDFNHHGRKFALNWSNDFLKIVQQPPGGCDDFFNVGLDDMINGTRNGQPDPNVYGWKDYIQSPHYKRIDGKPVVYILYPSTKGGPIEGSFEGLCSYCRNSSFFPSNIRGFENTYGDNIDHAKTAFLLNTIKSKLVAATDASITDVYFVAVISTIPDDVDDFTSADDWNNKWNWLIRHPWKAGFDASTTYRYQYFDKADMQGNSGWDGECIQSNEYSWTKYRSIYNEYYDYILNNSNIDYQIPVSSGWNNGPMTMYNIRVDSADPGYANANNLYMQDIRDCIDTDPNEFGLALSAAKSKADLNVSKTNRRITICCWNEVHEGSFIQPSHQHGYDFLNKVKTTFGTSTTGRIAEISSHQQVTDDPELSDRFDLYPNPAVDVVKLSYQIDNPGFVEVKVYDSTGKLIEVLVDELKETGRYNMVWKPKDELHGLYFLKVQADGHLTTEKIILN